MSTPDQIVTAVRRAVIHLSTQGSRFARAHGVNLTDIRALVVLLDLQRAGEATTPGALGSGLGLASASTTQVIDRLEQRGLVLRERDTYDRRRVSLQVTGQAIESGVASFEPLLQSVRDLATRRSAADQRVILSFLDDLAALNPNDE
ncbi:MarR family winged helix-turn-helix transcriptional regulator [Mobilicoccus caccae]|uniref:MarR family winged helix-turn-helix transcriptional regulator n=1 Tax=Mobilicoccus caccae TaxID=1859295 RepID=UPI0024E15B5E|nr:MarR family transcriptional regulator [Mobilicoccus caccae]